MYSKLLFGKTFPFQKAQCSIAGVIAHQGASMQENIQSWEEKRVVSKHALNLIQLDNGVKIPPR